MAIPTYSLLKKHDDVVSYRIPDPTDRTNAYVEVGLFPWQLEGASSEDVMRSWGTDEEPENSLFEGFGLRLKFDAPTRYHPRPPHIDDWMDNTFDLFSRGLDQSGKKYRIEEATAAELRETARSIAQYAHAYWCALTQSDTFTPGLVRDETSTERDNRLDIIEQVHNDGTIIYNDGKTTDSPFSLDTIELIDSTQWATATERCENEFNQLIDELSDKYSEKAVRQGYQNAKSDQIYSEKTKTDAFKEKQTFKNALRDIEGIGRQYRYRLINEFENLDALLEDLQNDRTHVQSISGIGEAKEEALVDALIDSNE